MFCAMPIALPSDERAPEDADDVAALEEREVERNLRDLAGGEADDEEAALPRHRTQRGLAVRAAHRVVDDVGADASRSVRECGS